MSKKLQDIQYTRGDSEPIVIIIKDKKGVLVDITGWSFKLTVSSEQYPTDETAQIFQSIGIPDVASSKVSFPITETNSNIVGTFFYDIERINSNGNKKTIQLPTKFIVGQDVTKT